MPSPKLVIRPATAEELDTAAETLEDASAWLGERGLEGWGRGAFLDESAYGRRALRSALAAGNLYLAFEGDRLAGTVTLQWEDPLFWPDAGDDAGYVHRLGLVGHAHGRGLGAKILTWAEAATLARGKRFLRLDCRRDDPRIRAYYEAAGFEHRGDLTVGPFQASRYQKDLSPPGT